MKSFVDEYSVDYRSQDDIEMLKGTPCESIVESLEECKKKSKSVFRKLLAATLLSLSIMGVVYQVTINKETPVLFSSTAIGSAREYDDFIFPLVMQDPPPFNSVEEVEPVILISTSLWQTVMSRTVDEFDADGRAIIHVKEMWTSYDRLFGASYHPKLPEKINNDFFSFELSENKFHINPTTNQKCYIPYTESLLRDGEDIILKVGYVSPNDKWRSLRNERPEKPDPVKFLNYRLVKNNNYVNIKSVLSA